MLFVYTLAFIGLLVLVVLAAAALAEDTTAEECDDPYHDALSAAARIQAGAWQAVHELGQLERRED